MIPKDTDTIELWLKSENIPYERGRDKGIGHNDICVLKPEFSEWGEINVTQMLYLIALKNHLMPQEIEDFTTKADPMG